MGRSSIDKSLSRALIMAWFEDLSPCDYFGGEFAECYRAVGWLGEGNSYATGSLSAEVVDRLRELLQAPWCYSVFMGGHLCEICRREVGTLNLFIPARGFLYVCPELILHYITEHQYRPPDEFCQAVLDCPPMDSAEYLAAIRTNAVPLARFLDDMEAASTKIEAARQLREQREQESLARREAMTRYGRPGVASWVTEYKAGEGLLKVRLHNEIVRMFTDDATGAEHVRTMQRLAASGKGLDEYICKERPRSIPDSAVEEYDARNNFSSDRIRE